MNELEQNLLFAAVTLMLTTTLVLFVVQYARSRRGPDGGDDD